METITVEINNGSPNLSFYSIFGANLKGQPKAGAGVHISVKQSSLRQVQATSQQDPFLVKGLKIVTNNEEQLSQRIDIFYQSATGHKGQTDIVPLEYQSPGSYNPRIVKTNDFKLNIDGNLGVQGQILAKTKLTIMFYIERTAKSNFSDFDPIQELLNSGDLWISGNIR